MGKRRAEGGEGRRGDIVFRLISSFFTGNSILTRYVSLYGMLLP